MEKMTPFRKRKADNPPKVEAFNQNKFVKDFVKIIRNENLSEDQKTQMLYDHCLYDKNSPFINKG